MSECSCGDAGVYGRAEDNNWWVWETKRESTELRSGLKKITEQKTQGIQAQENINKNTNRINRSLTRKRSQNRIYIPINQKTESYKKGLNTKTK